MRQESARPEPKKPREDPRVISGRRFLLLISRGARTREVSTWSGAFQENQCVKTTRGVAEPSFHLDTDTERLQNPRHAASHVLSPICFGAGLARIGASKIRARARELAEAKYRERKM